MQRRGYFRFAGARHDKEVRARKNALWGSPLRKIYQRIHTDDQEKVCAGKLLLKRLQCVRRIRRSVAIYFDSARSQLFFPGKCCFDERETILRGLQIGVALVWGIGGDDKQHKIELRLIARGARYRQVRVVDRIEGAAEDTDAARITHESDRRPG